MAFVDLVVIIEKHVLVGIVKAQLGIFFTCILVFYYVEYDNNVYM